MRNFCTLPFTFNSGKGYDDTGTSTVWHRGCASGLEKRQCTVQLTVFADGRARVKPLLMFRGKGLRIAEIERKQYDGRVVVRFQDNAWCDEEIMKFWVGNMWKRPFGDDVGRKKLLVADVHKAQTTNVIQDMLISECQTALALVPPGTTSLIQPLDVSINSEFKNIIERLQNQHMHGNVIMYIEGKISASQRRVLISKWVGQAWTEICSKKEMISHAFEKCGISIPINGSKDHLINIKGLPDYRVSVEQDEGLFELDSSSEDETIED